MSTWITIENGNEEITAVVLDALANHFHDTPVLEAARTYYTTWAFRASDTSVTVETP